MSVVSLRALKAVRQNIDSRPQMGIYLRIRHSDLLQVADFKEIHTVYQGVRRKVQLKIVPLNVIPTPPLPSSESYKTF
jgi:hypothetical protein